MPDGQVRAGLDVAGRNVCSRPEETLTTSSPNDGLAVFAVIRAWL
jgi:hypothetical protein